uniref:Uncharacterized protein n=1 Tax=Dunaliella tertiolecta TaxID=3047 RepID=A0A7S3QX93_DUNTE|mmetsp:Transcript_2354/g.5347  ORF Transcript_2354/g.5347 Transcript_2354/m.5347 type:complete len:2031 (+) Transcript_2354:1321-7413(+)|eukprot:CAMPEP_0202401822 /NCGR_PEP_ID=MMETSP1128-20130828/3759_1 /ASSEMBLY_ACC=CAM_ASM_000463 /TAXON_ID=3047 /ORGANISM="Dunaliella tertiolecta, Strain CCMP1320" /LENGTH=2030 /DNA_ID=CAMNT_0049005703 /DNA_START=157 /DNA_END=6249 /DNA_ORIENTATION=-
MAGTGKQSSSEDVLQLLRVRAGLLPSPPSKLEDRGLTSMLSRLKDAGMMDAFAEWEREEAERQLALVASGHLDPSALTLSSPKEEEKPLYAFLLSVFDERVQAAVKMQRAFRQLRRQCKEVGWPSSENPYHWIHFVDVRKQIGWSKEELYDEYGEPRERTDGGRAPKRKKEATGSEITTHAKYMDAIGNYKERNAGRMPFDGDTQLLTHLQLHGNRIDLSLIGSFLASRWWKMRQAKLAAKLDLNPLKNEFREGSVQYNELKRWMLGNGHGGMMLMHNPLVRDLKTSLNYVPADNQAKIMGLLGQFNNVLQYKQGSKQTMKMNRHVVGMYEWVMQDVANAYRDELEEARRWAVTPPEPPEGLDDEMMEMYEDVMTSLSQDTNRMCRLRKYGRRWLQAFEDSTWKRRRIIRTRSAGTLGLLGPSHIDPSQTHKILPVVGEYPSNPAKEAESADSTFAAAKKAEAFTNLRPHTLHIQLRSTVEKQRQRAERGRALRPLHCINTAWLGGVDWETIEAKALGRPLPGGVRVPPPPTDEELGDLMEDVFEGSEAEGSQAEEEEGEEEEEEGEEEGEEARESKKVEKEKGNKVERGLSRLNREKVAKTKVSKYRRIPFDVDCYVDEVQDIMQELGLTGLHCRDLLDRLMIGARAPTMVPELDATLTAKGCDAALRTLPVALTNKRRREAQKEFGAEVIMHNEHAVVGSLGHAEVLAEVIEEQGVTLPPRPLSAVLPSQLGRAVDRAFANPHLLPDLPSDSDSDGEGGQDGATPSIMSRAYTQAYTRRAPSIAGTAKPTGRASTGTGDKLGSLPTFNRVSTHGRMSSLPSGQAPSEAGMRVAPSIAGARARPFTVVEEEAWATNNKARIKHKATLGERLKKPEMTWEMLKQAWNQGGLPGIQGQDGRCLLVQMEKGSWDGTIIRKSPEQLREAAQALGATTSKGTSPSLPELQTRPSIASSTFSQSMAPSSSSASVEYYPNGLVAAKEMAVRKNQEIMAKVRAAELRRRAAAGIRIDNSKSLYAGILGNKNEGGQPTTATVAEGDNEGEDANVSEGPDLQNWQAEAREGALDPEDPENDLVEPPAPRVFEPPTSDMMLLRRNEWWATILADATVMQELSHRAIKERLRGRNKWTTSEVPVREKRRQDELKLLEAYVDRFHTMQHYVMTHPVRVGTAEIVETTPLEQRYMHQDWCTLFKSEMFMWLNQYLTRGTLPSSASRPGHMRPKCDFKPLKRAQQQQEKWMQAQRERWALEQQQKYEHQPKGALGIAIQGKKPPTEEQPGAGTPAFGLPPGKEHEAMQVMQTMLESHGELRANLGSGREAAEAAAKAFGTTIMYDSGSEDEELHNLPQEKLQDPNFPLPLKRNVAKAKAQAGPKASQSEVPNSRGNGGSQLAQPPLAHAPAPPTADKPLAGNKYSAAARRAFLLQSPPQQQQQPQGGATTTAEDVSFPLAAAAPQGATSLPPSRGSSLEARLEPLQPPAHSSASMSPTSSPANSSDNNAVFSDPSATTPSKPQLEPPSSEGAQDALPPATAPPENNREREPPSLMAARGSVKGADAAPLMSVKGIGPRATSATTASRSSLERTAAKPRVAGEGTVFSHMTQEQARAALRAAQEQDAWMAAAQGREVVAGIALPRRPQGGLLPGVLSQNGVELTLNELRDGSLPSPKPQGYLFSTVRQQQQQAAARAARLQRAIGYQQQQSGGGPRSASLLQAFGEGGEFTAGSLGMGGMRPSSTQAPAQSSLDGLGRLTSTQPVIRASLDSLGRFSSTQPVTRASLDSLGIRAVKPSPALTLSRSQQLRPTIPRASSSNSLHPSPPPTAPPAMAVGGGVRFSGARAAGNASPMNGLRASGAGVGAMGMSGSGMRASLEGSFNAGQGMGPASTHKRSSSSGDLAGQSPSPAHGLSVRGSSGSFTSMVGVNSRSAPHATMHAQSRSVFEAGPVTNGLNGSPVPKTGPTTDAVTGQPGSHSPLSQPGAVPQGSSNVDEVRRSDSSFIGVRAASARLGSSRGRKLSYSNPQLPFLGVTSASSVQKQAN